MPTTVVGAAVIRGGRILAARRTSPPELAGLWELPGGKVEDDESEQDALARELFEELDLVAWVGPLIQRVPLDRRRNLAIYACTATGEPLLGEDHDDLRWLRLDELDEVEWVDADRALLPAVVAHLHDRAEAGTSARLLSGAVAGIAVAVTGVVAGLLFAARVRISCGSDIDSLIKLVCTEKTYPHLLPGLLIAGGSLLVGGGVALVCLRHRRHVT